MQCYCCQRFGHKKESPKCPLRNSNNNTCLYCADQHASKICQHKSNKTKHKCSNCLDSKNPIYKENALGHTSNSFECPILQQELKVLRNKTLGEDGNRNVAKNAIAT